MREWRHVTFLGGESWLISFVQHMGLTLNREYIVIFQKEILKFLVVKEVFIFSDVFLPKLP